MPCGRTGYLYLLRGDLPHAMPLLAQSLDVCQTGQVYLLLPRVMAYLGYAYALAGRLPEALPLLEQAQAIQEQARATGRGSLARQARIVALLSEAYLLAGRLDDARQGAARALSLARTHEERGSEAWTLRLLGDLAAQEPAVQGAAAASPLPHRPSPWPRSWACARSRRTATAASGRCTPDKASGSRRTPRCPPPSTCTATWR